MTKLGNAFVNLFPAFAVVPNQYTTAPNGTQAVSGYEIHYPGGGIVFVECSEAEMIQALEAEDLIAPSEEEAVLSFSIQEQNALLALYQRNFRFLAKDENGKLFAYVAPPSKGKHSWLNDERYPVLAVHDSFEQLSFEDAAPLDIARYIVDQNL